MSKIEWTGETWNPIVGCSVVSPGCTNCYAMKMAARLEAMAGDGLDDNGYSVCGAGPLDHYRGTTKRSKAGPVWTGKLARAPDSILTKPLRWKSPRTVFVNSMSDLFHESVPDEWIDRVFAVMALTPQHTYQILTKRSARMRAYVTDWSWAARAAFYVGEIAGPSLAGIGAATELSGVKDLRRPLWNVWLGISAERQQEADARIPDLLATPAAVRFVSAEPLLGPVDFTHLKNGPAAGSIDALSGDARNGRGEMFPIAPWPSLDWIIIGGESGPGARPMHPDWAREIRDQCAAAGVAFFFKQWGAWAPGENVERTKGAVDVAYNDDPFDDGRWSFGSELLHVEGGHIDDEPTVYRVGKRDAGRLLDGREWNEMPATQPAAKETA